MDATTKLFIFMLIISLLLGCIIIFVLPEYRIEKIYQSNKSYYPQINEESLKIEFEKLFKSRGSLKNNN